MSDIDSVLRQVDLPQRELERWIAKRWVCPDGEAGVYFFHAIDVARIRLILQLRQDLEINEKALPVVLGLLDQLYDHRRRLRALAEALQSQLPPDILYSLREHLDQS